MFLYDLSFIDVLRQNTTVIIFLWASKEVVGCKKVKRLGVLPQNFQDLCYYSHMWFDESIVEFCRTCKRKCCALSGNQWPLESLVSESKPGIFFTRLKDAATVFFVDRQWVQSAKKMVQNVKRSQVYSAKNKTASIFYFPNLGPWRSSSKKWNGNCMPNWWHHHFPSNSSITVRVLTTLPCCPH